MSEHNRTAPRGFEKHFRAMLTWCRENKPAVALALFGLAVWQRAKLASGAAWLWQTLAGQAWTIAAVLAGGVAAVLFAYGAIWARRRLRRAQKARSLRQKRAEGDAAAKPGGSASILPEPKMIGLSGWAGLLGIVLLGAASVYATTYISAALSAQGVFGLILGGLAILAAFVAFVELVFFHDRNSIHALFDEQNYAVGLFWAGALFAAGCVFVFAALAAFG